MKNKKLSIAVILTIGACACISAISISLLVNHEKKHLPSIHLSDNGVTIEKSKSQDVPSSVYMNGLGYFASRDPQAQEAEIQDFVIANYNSHNRVQWENTDSHDLFTLINIANPSYDDNGIIVSGDLVWGKQTFN